MAGTEASFAPRDAHGLPEGLVLFDGECPLCSRWVRFVQQRDPGKHFRFIAMQSEEGRGRAASIGLNADNPPSHAFVSGGQVWFKSDAAIEILKRLEGWSAVQALHWTPRFLRDAIYDQIARNRRLIFRGDSCQI